MTAFAIQLGARRVAIAADTLVYLPDRRQVRPMGFTNKVLALPHLRAALFGRGQHELCTRAWIELMADPSRTSVEAVAAKLPAMLRSIAEAYCRREDLPDYREIGLLELVLVGWSPRANRIRLWQFLSYRDFVSEEADKSLQGFMTLPRLPAVYVPVVAGRPPTAALIEGVLACGRYFEAEPDVNCGMRIGGEVIATEITPKGVSVRVVHRFADYEETGVAAAALVRRIESGDLAREGLLSAGLVPVDELIDSATGEGLTAA